MIDKVCEFYHRGAKIFLNGAITKSVIWAESYNNIDIVLDNLIIVLTKYDKQICIKLLIPENNKNICYHPSNPDWAYSRISLKDMPSIKLSDDDLREIKKELKKLEKSNW